MFCLKIRATLTPPIDWWPGHLFPSQNCRVACSTAASNRTAADDEDEVMEEESEKEKEPWKCLEGSNGFFIYKNMAENSCGSSPEWGESTVAMAQ